MIRLLLFSFLACLGCESAPTAPMQEASAMAKATIPRGNRYTYVGPGISRAELNTAVTEHPAALSGSPAINADAYRTLILSDSPFAYWRLGETSGSVAVDELGNHHGAYVGDGITLNQSQLIRPGVDPSVQLSYNSTPNYINAGTLGDFGTQLSSTGFSFECWFTHTTTGSSFTFIGMEQTGDETWRDTPYISLVYSITSGWINLVWSDANTSNFFLLASFDASALDNGKAHHLVITAESGDAQAYQNGLLLSRPSFIEVGSPPTTPFVSNFRFGVATQREDTYTSVLDEVAIYDKVLTAAEVAEHYVTGRPNQFPAAWRRYRSLDALIRR